jgi:hypothetical protein
MNCPGYTTSNMILIMTDKTVLACFMVLSQNSNNVLNDVSKWYYVAEMDENKYQYQYQFAWMDQGTPDKFPVSNI